MKKVNVIFTSFLLVLLLGLSSAFGGIQYNEFPEKIDGLNLAEIEDLFVKASMHPSKTSPNTLEKGDSEAQYKLGVIFYHILKAGRTVVREKEASWPDDLGNSLTMSANYTQMMYWLKKAAMQDHAQAQFLLGYINYWGMYMGGVYDIDEMFKWYEKAAANGHARAMAHLADAYMVMRHDLPEHNKKAFSWAEKAANKGDALGMYVLSLLYGKENFKGFDKAKSDEWKKKALETAKTDPTINFDD